MARRDRYRTRGGNRLDRTYLQSAVRLNVVDLLLARAIADDKA
jgi:hypothetical protein